MRRQPEGFIQLFHVIVQANDFYLKFYCLLSEVDHTRQSHASGGFWWLSLSLPFFWKQMEMNSSHMLVMFYNKFSLFRNVQRCSKAAWRCSWAACSGLPCLSRGWSRLPPEISTPNHSVNKNINIYVSVTMKRDSKIMLNGNTCYWV